MGVLPIGFFAPLPLAIMIPFMAAQSFAMGDAFGTSFQYGKRKISSLSNEEFNKLDMVSLHDSIQHDIRDMIPAMNQSFERMQEFQIDIIKSMLETLLVGIQKFGEFVTGGLGSATSQPDVKPEPSFGGTVIDDLTFGLLPPALADTGPGDQKFVKDYVKEAEKLPFKLLAQIVEKMLSGKLQKPIERKIAYIQVYKSKLPEKKEPTLTITEGIEKFTTKGSIVQQIALKFNEVKKAMALWQGLKKSPLVEKKAKSGSAKSKWLILVKKYNQFVQANGFPKMTIDVAKSMQSGKLVGKKPK